MPEFEIGILTDFVPVWFWQSGGVAVAVKARPCD
jgi:hypothetical protein